MTSITNSLAPPQHLVVASTQMPILPEMMAPIIITGGPVTQVHEETTLLVDSTPYTPRNTVAQWPTKTINGSTPTQIDMPTEYQSLGPTPQGSYATDSKPPNPTVFHLELDLQKADTSQKEAYPSEDEESIRLHREKLAATKCRPKNTGDDDSLESLAARDLEPKNNFYWIQTKTERREDVYYFKNEILHRSECDSDLIQFYLLDEAEDGAETAITRTISKRTNTAKTPLTLRIG